jgi:N-acetylmuramoyl-L-alanine amidase
MSVNISDPLKLSRDSFQPRQHTKYLVVHCSATSPIANIGARDIDAMHRQQGWGGIGYHYVIRRDGTIERGRPFTTIGAHVKGFNSQSIGICLVGGVDREMRPRENFTLHQYESLRNLLSTLKQTYRDAQIVGHRDLSPDRNGDGTITPDEWLKACPCFDVREWVRKVGL